MKNWIIRKMIYPAPWIPVHNPPAPLQEVKIPFSGNDTAIGWLYHLSKTSDKTPVLLFFHGNGENLQTIKLSGLIDDFLRLEAHFLVLDYPGYGKSSGSACETMILEAADSAFQWIGERYPENPKIVCGWSLGAAVAFQIAAKHSQQLDGLIALSPWTSLAAVARAHYPDWLVNMALSENYNSLEAAPNIDCPVLIIHGEWDRIIPISQGEKIAACFHQQSALLRIPRTGHNDLFSQTQVWEAIQKFLLDISVLR